MRNTDPTDNTTWAHSILSGCLRSQKTVFGPGADDTTTSSIMGFMEKSSQAQTGKDGEDNDLKTLLSSEQREDFSLLIVTITEEMKQQTRDIFDASFSAPKNPDDPRLHHGNPNISPSEMKSSRAGLEEEERQERLKREKEVSAPEIQQTKRDILTHRNAASMLQRRRHRMRLWGS